MVHEAFLVAVMKSTVAVFCSDDIVRFLADSGVLTLWCLLLP